MKQILTAGLFLLACFYHADAQVGLLSTNNEKKRAAADTSSLKLAAIEKPEYLARQINVDTAVRTYSPLINDILRKVDSLYRVKDIGTTAQRIAKNRSYREAVQKKETIAPSKNRNDSLLTRLLQENFAARQISWKRCIDSLSDDYVSFSKSLDKSDFLTRHYPIDTAKQVINFESFTRTMSDVYAEIHRLMKNSEQRARSIDKLQASFASIKLPNPLNTDAIDSTWSDIDRQFRSLQADTANIRQSYRKDTAEYKRQNAAYEKILKDNVASKTKPAETTKVNAFPQLSSILGKRQVVPSLQAVGTYNYENKNSSVEANLGLSIAPGNTADTLTRYNLFVPSVSTFMAHANFTYSFFTGVDTLVKKLALNLGVKFATKNMVWDTSAQNKSRVTSSVIYTRTGIEYGVIPKRLSIYGNVNTVTLLDNIDDFKKATNIDSKFFGYLDFGAKMYLDPTPNAKIDDGLYIYGNIDCIINGGDVQRITKSSALAIPIIEIGIVKTLGKL